MLKNTALKAIIDWSKIISALNCIVLSDGLACFNGVSAAVGTEPRTEVWLRLAEDPANQVILCSGTTSNGRLIMLNN
jgi:hypothetical protein